MRVYDTARREDYNGLIGIELRGFTSQQSAPKKPYSIETRKESGDNRNVSLLGMPADDDWVLIASYEDESLLRNFVAYSTARWLGRYAARTRLVEVVLNGSYEGVYLLAEDLKVHEDRVAVDDSDISGGYLLEMISTRRTAGRAVLHDSGGEPARHLQGPQARGHLAREGRLDPRLRRPVRAQAVRRPIHGSPARLPPLPGYRRRRRLPAVERALPERGHVQKQHLHAQGRGRKARPGPRVGLRPRHRK